MAIQGDYTIKREHFDGALKMNDCYIKIKNLNVISKGHARVELGLYKVEQEVSDVPIPDYMTTANEVGIDVISVPINHEGEGYFKQAYNYIKTLPQYADCTDC